MIYYIENKALRAELKEETLKLPQDLREKINANFEKMKQFASILSKDIPHVRVDFYEINGKLYFGELTFFTASGYIPFHDEKWNKKLGDMIDLRLVKNNEKQKSNL